MASNRIDINVNGKDNTKAAFNSAAGGAKKLQMNMDTVNHSISTTGKNASKMGVTVGSALNKISTMASKVGTTIGQSINRGATTAKGAVTSFASGASGALKSVSNAAITAGKAIGSKISAGAKQAKASLDGMTQSMDSLSGAMAGVIGGAGTMELFSQSMSGAMVKEQSLIQLNAKFGSGASQIQKQIEQIAEITPGDDTVLRNLLSQGAMSANITDMETMNALAQAYAGYAAGSLKMGKNMGEVQRDLNDYIFTGNTGVLEMDSIYRDHVDELKAAKNEHERIAVLNKLNKDHFNDLLANSDSLANAWELIKGRVGTTLTDLGTEMLPTIKSIVKFVLDLDVATGGWSTKLGIVGVAVVGIVAGLGLLWQMMAPIVTSTASAAIAMKKYATEAWSANAANRTNKGPGMIGGGKTGVATSIGGMLIIADLIYAATSAWDKFNYSAGQTQDKVIQLSSAFEGFGQALPLPALMSFFAGVDTGSAATHSRVNADIEGMRAKWYDFTHNLTAKWNGAGAYLRGAWNNTASWFNGLTSRLGQLWGELTSYISGAWRNTVNWIKNGMNSAAGAVRGAWNKIMGSARGAIKSIMDAWNGLKSLVKRGVSGVVSIFANGLTSVWNSVTSLYDKVRNGVTGVVNIVQQIIGGPGSPRGPNGPVDDINFNYENYGGWQKNAWTGSNSMSGNCADMTSGLIQRFGGSMVSGTWNGNPHVWWKSPTGQEIDPARKALNGTFSPPPRGPSATASGNNVIIQGDVYGYDDFVKKVEQASNSIVSRVY